MSIEVMTAVWDYSTAYGGDLVMMLSIANYADINGRAYPSIRTLAQRGRMTERNAQYCIQKLERLGELKVERNAGPHGCHVFQITLQGANFSGCKVFTHQRKRKRNKDLTQERGEKFSGVQSLQTETGFTGGVKPISPEPSLDPSVKEITTDIIADREFMLTAIEGLVSEIPSEAKRSAKLFHFTLIAKIREMGWQCQQEYTLKGQDQPTGRVDVYISHPAPVAIELDRLSPRDKSITKLRSITALRIIILRECAHWADHIDGIDAILACGKQPQPTTSHYLPSDYHPSEQNRQNILKTYPGTDVDRQVEAMQDWARSHAVKRSDWEAVLRTFARRDWERRGAPTSVHQPHRPTRPKYQPGDIRDDGSIQGEI
jgi:hypothetical protein